MTIEELDDLVYLASYRASNQATSSLYKGLSLAYFNRWNDDIKTILEEIEQLKLRNDTNASQD